MGEVLLVQSFTGIKRKINTARFSNIQTHRYKNRKIHAKELEMLSKSQSRTSHFIAALTCTRMGPQRISYEIQCYKEVWS